MCLLHLKVWYNINIWCYFPVKIGTSAITRTFASSRRFRYSRVPLHQYFQYIEISHIYIIEQKKYLRIKNYLIILIIFLAKVIQYLQFTTFLNILPQDLVHYPSVIIRYSSAMLNKDFVWKTNLVVLFYSCYCSSL